MNKKALLATTAAAFFAATIATAANAADVKCSGINSCKGTSACKSGDHACKGQNSCKGQGWTPTASAKDCTDKGGKVL